MNETIRNVEMSTLNFWNLFRTPKIHALEHATISVLNERFQRRKIAGLSTPFGFVLIGPAAIEEVRDAFDIALSRLNAGEKDLALSKNCGTNLAVTGALCALAAIIIFSGTKNAKDRFRRFDVLALSAALISRIGPKLGFAAQRRVTTNADVRRLAVDGIYQTTVLGQDAFFVRIISEEAAG